MGGPHSVTWPVRSGAIPPLASGFMARPDTAGGVETALVPGAAVAIIADEAAADWRGSCGKTQIAVSAAESLWRSSRVELLVWITATSRASVLSGYVRAVEAMGAAPVGDAEAITARFLRWLATSERPWLVVFDDLSDPKHVDGLWPDGPTGRILITSTAPVSHPAKQDTPTVKVGAFSLREAMNYVVGRLTAGPHLRTGAFGLIEDLGGEPLALTQATAVMKSSGISCNDYRDKVGRRRQETIGGRPASAAVTWTFSLEYAEMLSPGAQFLLLLGALLDGRGIPATVFTSSAVSDYLSGVGAPGLAPPDQARTAIFNLDRAGLLTVNTADSPPTVRLSSVVQAAVRSVMPARAQQRAAKAAAAALLQVWPQEEPHAGTADELRSCAAALQRSAGDLLWQGGCHPLLLRFGRSLDMARLVGPAVAYWTELAARGERLLGSGHPDVLTIYGQLAGAYLAAGRAVEAAGLRERSVVAWLRTAGPEHPGTLAARAGFGRALAAAGRPGDGVGVLVEAVAEYERVLSPDQVDTLAAREELADARRIAGQFADAVESYRRTLADRERIQGPRHPDTTAARQKLAEAYLAEGRTKEAVSHFKRALADQERALGPDHPSTIAVRARLGAAQSSGGRMASALRCFEQAHSDSERVLGPDHPASLERGLNLAHTFYAVGRLTDATTLLRDIAARCERVLPSGDALTKTVRESLANIAGG